VPRAARGIVESPRRDAFGMESKVFDISIYVKL